MTNFDEMITAATAAGEEARKQPARTRGPNLRTLFKQAPAGATAEQLTRWVLGLQGFESSALDAMTDQELAAVLRVGRRAIEWASRHNAEVEA